MGAVLPILFADVPPTRWANGLGETRELHRMPCSGEFTVRLSIATVSGAVGFSELPGVDRALMALSPGGLRLGVGGRRVELAQHETVSFAGEDAVASLDAATTTHDLNLMVRRGRGRPSLAAVPVAGRLETPPGTLAAVALTDGLAARGVRLAFGDTIVGAGAAIRGVGVVAIASITDLAAPDAAPERTTA